MDYFILRKINALLLIFQNKLRLHLDFFRKETLQFKPNQIQIGVKLN